MPPAWLTALAWAALAVAFACAAWVAYDIFGRGHRQHLKIMEAVWPITALYLGPAAMAAYRAWGRRATYEMQMENGPEPGKPGFASTFMSVSHCGAGCSLGDILAEWVIFALAVSLAGLALFGEYIGDYLAALAFGIVFQYFAIAPVRHLTLGKGLIEAAKADFLSITAFEIGLFGWMALMVFVFFPGPHLAPNSPVFWFLMQVGMICGFITSWPVNVWLIRAGIKEAM